MKKKKLSFSTKILLSLILGVCAGLLLQNHIDIATTYIQPIGTIFLNLLKMIVVPVVLFSIIQGIISLKDIRKVGSIGLKTILFYLATTVFAVFIGILFANILSVGGGYQLNTDTLTSVEAAAPVSFIDTIINAFPSNWLSPLVNANMLQVIALALFFGFGIIKAGEKGKPVADFVESFSTVTSCIMESILKLSPIGVFALITPVIAQNGPSVLLPLIKLIGVVYLACIVHMLIIYSSCVRVIGGIGPVDFFKGMMPAILFAFSSASSIGTLPLNIECTEKLGAKKDVASFVLPLGATINMDGTCIYQGVCAIFIAQIFGIDLSIADQLMIVVTSTLASIGTAGVPGAGVIMLTMVLQSVGLPLEGIALITGVDRILDMARTTVNITGDAACTLCISKLEELKEAKAQRA